jgi:hypothetical protein
MHLLFAAEAAIFSIRFDSVVRFLSPRRAASTLIASTVFAGVRPRLAA